MKRNKLKKKMSKGREVNDIKYNWDADRKISGYTNKKGIIGPKEMAALRET